MGRTHVFELSRLTGLEPAIRLRIEEAVLEAFAEDEFRRVNLAELASRGKTSLQTIYKYYGSKEALVFATLDRELAELSAALNDQLGGSEIYKNRLRKVYWIVLEYFERKPAVAALIHASIHGNAWSHNVPFCQPELMATFTRLVEEGRVLGDLTDEVEPSVVLDFFLGVLWRLVHSWLMRGRVHSPTREAGASFEVLWRALAKPR